MSQDDSIVWDDLLRRSKEGDHTAQAELALRLHNELEKVLERRLRNRPPQDREDLLQETLATFWEKLYECDSNPHWFALKIMRNKVGDYFRKQSSHRSLHLEEDCQYEAVDSIDLTKEMEGQDFVNHFVKAVSKLSEFCQKYIRICLETMDTHIGQGAIWQMLRREYPILTRNNYYQKHRRCEERLERLLSPCCGPIKKTRRKPK